MTRRFTGRHMLAIMLAFFGVVISVNLVMATLAASTFGGKVVENSFVAGQHFNGWLAEARAQERLGWSATASLDSSRRINVAAETSTGSLNGARVDAIARHPLGRASDVTLQFRQVGHGSYLSNAPLPAGRWQVHFEIRRGAALKRQIEILS